MKRQNEIKKIFSKIKSINEENKRIGVERHKINSQVRIAKLALKDEKRKKDKKRTAFYKKQISQKHKKDNALRKKVASNKKERVKLRNRVKQLNGKNKGNGKGHHYTKSQRAWILLNRRIKEAKLKTEQWKAKYYKSKVDAMSDKNAKKNVPLKSMNNSKDNSKSKNNGKNNKFTPAEQEALKYEKGKQQWMNHHGPFKNAKANKAYNKWYVMPRHRAGLRHDKARRRRFGRKAEMINNRKHYNIRNHMDDANKQFRTHTGVNTMATKAAKHARIRANSEKNPMMKIIRQYAALGPEAVAGDKNMKFINNATSPANAARYGAGRGTMHTKNAYYHWRAHRLKKRERPLATSSRIVKRHQKLDNIYQNMKSDGKVDGPDDGDHPDGGDDGPDL